MPRDVRRAPLLALILLLAVPLGVWGQRSPEPTMKPDRNIQRLLRHVSSERVGESIRKLASFHTRHTLSAGDPEAAASGQGIAAAREWIRSQFARYSKDCGGCLEVQTQTFIAEPGPRVPEPTEIVNVVATLRGADDANAGRVYVISGHYDSRASDPMDTQNAAPGANDDASGTAVVLEAARVLSRSRFPATIIFLAVAGEEQGLLGSRHFAQTARQRGRNIEAVLNNDIVGGNKDPRQDANIVRVFSEGIPRAASEEEMRRIRALGAENDSPSRQLARYIREVAEAYLEGPFGPKMIFRPDRYLRGGDHTSFNEQGYPAVRFTEYREDYNHQHQNVREEGSLQYGDLPEFVDFDYVANVARLNIATLASLASAPAPPQSVRLLTEQLENDSTLVWEASPGGLASGYEILWRKTTAPEWEYIEPVGDVTRVALKHSKDNVIFAVRAYDKKSHRSLPVMPVPERGEKQQQPAQPPARKTSGGAIP